MLSYCIFVYPILLDFIVNIVKLVIVMGMIYRSIMRDRLRCEYNRKLNEVRRIRSELEELLERYRKSLEDEHSKTEKKSFSNKED